MKVAKSDETASGLPVVLTAEDWQVLKSCGYENYDIPVEIISLDEPFIADSPIGGVGNLYQESSGEIRAGSYSYITDGTLGDVSYDQSRGSWGKVDGASYIVLLDDAANYIKKVYLYPGADFREVVDRALAPERFGPGADYAYVEALTDLEKAQTWVQGSMHGRPYPSKSPLFLTVGNRRIPAFEDSVNFHLYGDTLFGRLAVLHGNELLEKYWSVEQRELREITKDPVRSAAYVANRGNLYFVDDASGSFANGSLAHLSGPDGSGNTRWEADLSDVPEVAYIIHSRSREAEGAGHGVKFVNGHRLNLNIDDTLLELLREQLPALKVDLSSAARETTSGGTTYHQLSIGATDRILTEALGA